MRSVLLAAASILTAVLFSTTALAGDGGYVSLNLGLAEAENSEVTDSTLPGAVMKLDYDSGFTAGMALGYQFRSFGIEGELAYQKTDLEKIALLGAALDLGGDASAVSLLANGYYNFVFGDFPLIPYLSAGIGLAQISINNMRIPGLGQLDWSDDDIVFAYQLGGGLEMSLGSKFSIGAKYRYFGTSDPEYNTTDIDFTSHNILLIIKRFF